MARAALVAGAALILAGGAAVGYGVTRKAVGGMPPENTAAMATAVATLDGDLKAARAAIEQRAKTLADVGTVRAAVGTDAATALDMAGREIAFQPEPGEVIELGQLPRGGGEPISLVVLPEGGMRSTFSGKAGAFAELMQDRLLVTQTVTVVPSDPQLAEQVSGFVTVSRSLALDASLERLAAAGLAGRIEVGDQRRAFGTPPAEENGAWQAMPIPSQPGVQLVAAVPPATGGMPVPVVGGGAGAVVLGLVLLCIGVLTGRERQSSGRAAEPALQVGGTGTLAPAPGDPASASSASSTAASAASSTASSTASIVASIGPGTQIGRWEVIRRLGSGGMADVYLAHARGEAGFEKLVALKVMHPHLTRIRAPSSISSTRPASRLASRTRTSCRSRISARSAATT